MKTLRLSGSVRLFAAALALLCVATWPSNSSALLIEEPAPAELAGAAAQGSLFPLLEAAVTRVVTVIRNVYPLSVIRGGAFSVAELQAHAAADPVVRKSIDAQAKRLKDPGFWEHLKPKVAPRPISKHTQLREGEKLSWSNKPVTVQAGETVFVHEPTGEWLVRGRCGNVMLDTVPESGDTRPPPSEEPTPETVDLPVPDERVVDVVPAAGVRLPPALVAAGAVPPIEQDIPIEVAMLPPGVPPLLDLPPLLPPLEAAPPVLLPPEIVAPLLPPVAAIPAAAVSAPLWWPIAVAPLIPLVPGITDDGKPVPPTPPEVPEPPTPPDVPEPPTPEPTPGPPDSPQPPKPPAPSPPPVPPPIPEFPPLSPPLPPLPGFPPTPPPPPPEQPVPEPGSWALLAIAAGGIAASLRKRRRKRSTRSGVDGAAPS